ncbi:DUF2188 domain-containing protein (plasmid) [Ensifer adhaerens]|uniref:DUF2188 domain-containing protein n=1 Tax=Ensifer adhaerens TaxID=106592 RepID=UPI001CC01612|nr:DUF2188 domain-containing protein [Ensifer adhaerens]MBZ7927632.1 DUF2188 domain-containing protein [Ensifer adhaerens]UAX98031.1 DUF2188 domain-containing protein [Ensifer adhaerens]UAY05412.1 DUF2188 domain-containing protein [Ensifer adhaerens]UAY12790.1 DUF2188 domain-containing protein [Ensifer adhaerens]
MQKIRYEVVQHDGGWAYKVNDGFSETFSTHGDALAAAKIAANQHEAPGSDEQIEFQDAKGRWHEQTSSGFDRPQTEVIDTRPQIAEQQADRAGPLKIFLLATSAVLVMNFLLRLSRRR